jgi:hypothetical protein
MTYNLYDGVKIVLKMNIVDVLEHGEEIAQQLIGMMIEEGLK